MISAATRWRRAGTGLVVAAAAWVAASTLWTDASEVGQSGSAPWTMHVIAPGAPGAGSLDGADGVSVADVDGDGLPDVASGAEQGLMGVVCFNPGPAGSLVQDEWTDCVELPAVPPDIVLCSPEDFHLADLNADTFPDAIAACETGTDKVTLFLNPGGTRTTMLDGTNWTRVGLDDADAASARFMKVATVDWTGDAVPEIVAMGKESDGPATAAAIGYFTATLGNEDDPAAWNWVPIDPMGWGMELYLADVTGDGKVDIVGSDNEPINTPGLDNTRRGIGWWENDGAEPPVFTRTQISASVADFRWFDLVDKDGDGDLDILACRSTPTVNELTWYINGGLFASFTTEVIPLSSLGVGRCLEPEFTDIDGDAIADIVVTSSSAQALHAVYYLKSGTTFVTISGKAIDTDSDVKFDNVVLVDMDGDGDLDVVTSEQHVPDGNGDGLGIVWYENPLIQFVAPPLPDAVNCTLLTNGTGTATATYDTAVIDPADNALILVAVGNAINSAPVPTGIAGNGLTYTAIGNVNFHTSNARRVSLWRAMGTGLSAGIATITFPGAQTSANWAVIECTGVDTSGTNGSGAVVQFDTSTAAAAVTITNTLAALASAESAHVCVTATSINGAQGDDAQFDGLSDQAIGTGANSLSTQWAINETDCTTTMGSSNVGSISIEVAIAP